MTKFIGQALIDLTASARAVFGDDISISVARCPAFGNDDVCYIVQGKRRAEVAINLAATLRDAKITPTSSEFMGSRMDSLIIEGTPRP